MSEEETQLLREIPITFHGPNGVEVGGAKPTITGSDDDPCINLFDVGVFGKGQQVALAIMNSVVFSDFWDCVGMGQHMIRQQCDMILVCRFWIQS